MDRWLLELLSSVFVKGTLFGLSVIIILDISIMGNWLKFHLKGVLDISIMGNWLKFHLKGRKHFSNFAYEEKAVLDHKIAYFISQKYF